MQRRRRQPRQCPTGLAHELAILSSPLLPLSSTIAAALQLVIHRLISPALVIASSHRLQAEKIASDACALSPLPLQHLSYFLILARLRACSAPTDKWLALVGRGATPAAATSTAQVPPKRRLAQCKASALKMKMGYGKGEQLGLGGVAIRLGLCPSQCALEQYCGSKCCPLAQPACLRLASYRPRAK